MLKAETSIGTNITMKSITLGNGKCFSTVIDKCYRFEVQQKVSQRESTKEKQHDFDWLFIISYTTQLSHQNAQIIAHN